MNRFSSAHVISAIALFIALTGTAIAVEKNSVGTKQLKDHAVKGSKLGDHAVTEAKIADDAVTGAKVKESTLGQVPSAVEADSATHAKSANTANRATTAGTATSATSATTATSAGTATTASNATQLEGRGLQAVRPSAIPGYGTSGTPLDVGAYTIVIDLPVDVPAGGADLLVNASFYVTNTSGASAQAACSMLDDAGTIDPPLLLTVPAGASVSTSLAGFADDVPATPQGNPQHVRLRCQGTGSAGDVIYGNGSMNVLRVPIG